MGVDQAYGQCAATVTRTANPQFDLKEPRLDTPYSFE